jgi:hypothetical protein
MPANSAIERAPPGVKSEKTERVIVDPCFFSNWLLHRLHNRGQRVFCTNHRYSVTLCTGTHVLLHRVKSVVGHHGFTRNSKSVVASRLNDTERQLNARAAGLRGAKWR